MQLRYCGFLFLVFCLSLRLASAEEDVAGSIKVLRGSAVVVRGSETLAAQAGLHLRVNDIIRTAAESQLGITLLDGTRLSMGPGTELKIDRFLYEPSAGRFGLVLQVARGIMAYISGKIAQFSPGSVSVETPAGIIGLRGTEFAVSIEGT